MTTILCSTTRISTKNGIANLRWIHFGKNIVIPADINSYKDESPLSNGRVTISNCRKNININNNPYLFNLHSRWFRSSAMHPTEHDVIVSEFPGCVPEGKTMWAKEIGDTVAAKETVCLIQTGKSDIEIPSPCNGVIIARYVKDGTKVKPKDKLLRIKLKPVGAKKTDKMPTVESPSATTPCMLPAPEVKPSKVNPEHQLGHRIQELPKPDVKSSSLAIVIKTQESTKKITGSRNEYGVKMSQMRKKIAKRLKDAQQNAVMLTTFSEIDMSNIIAFRRAHQEDFRKIYGIKLGYMPIFLKAAAYALEDQPIFNASIKGNQIAYRNYIDISVVIAIPKGVIVPVIRNVPTMSFADIERRISHFREKGKKGKLTRNDMVGGTFTVCNVGVFGSFMGIPSINPPQSGVLGMYAISERPVAIKKQVVIRPMMYVALTYDHRLIDVSEAVLFLQKLKKSVENPLIMIAGL
nr:dihydrolipoyllysine-residue succinyltransferase component of 2-oxoglutarate dehydrogenase complex, mitochondrial isoform X2 [Halyomorpha halys]